MDGSSRRARRAKPGWRCPAIFVWGESSNPGSPAEGLLRGRGRGGTVDPRLGRSLEASGCPQQKLITGDSDFCQPGPDMPHTGAVPRVAWIPADGTQDGVIAETGLDQDFDAGEMGMQHASAVRVIVLDAAFGTERRVSFGHEATSLKE